ncbi:hypothetical protein D9M68_165870 [compost metagenome]
MDAIKTFLNSSAFNRATHRAGAYLLLFSNLPLPLGLHRPWMGLSGWWWFPTAISMAAVGACNYMESHVAAWLTLVVPYPLLFVMDFWMLAVAQVPPGIDE